MVERVIDASAVWKLREIGAIPPKPRELPDGMQYKTKELEEAITLLNDGWALCVRADEKLLALAQIHNPTEEKADDR